jgi:serine/threonine protein kinase
MLILFSFNVTVHDDISSQNYKNVALLRELIEKMTEIDPDDRPTSAAALQTFEKLMGNKLNSTLRWRLHPRDEPFLRSLRLDAEYFTHELRFQLRRMKSAHG